MNNRVIFSNNGALEDFSVALNNYATGSSAFQFVAADDYLYIGARLPFNHIYFKVGNPNVNDSVMSVDYYDGNVWINTVEVIDETNAFKNSGHIQFTPNRTYGWAMRSTNYTGETVVGLESANIYDRYWIRISFSENLYGANTEGEDPQPTDVTLFYVGNVFSNDGDLGAEYPDLVTASTLTNFKSGKTNWEEQAVRAGQIIIEDLITKGIIVGAGQILDWREYTNASIHKIAEIAFNAFGDDYTDNVISARKEYNERLSKRLNIIDQNNDAVETTIDRSVSTGYFTR